ncbi:MAG: hypothetical protein E7058_10595 [Lentisphaerae bacterium]|nr:hypothetical protein [Lentisphaerota bacterium]
MSKRIAPDSPPLKFALTGFFFLLQAAVNFAILGIFGLLSPVNGIIAGAVSGLIFYYAATKILPLPETVSGCEPLAERSVRLLQIAVVSIIGLVIFKSVFIMGTDPYLYHLYYPSMWLLYGRIHAVTLIGLPHEYFPVCGETLFGWLMLSGSDIFAVMLQPLTLIMSLCAIAGLWRSYRIPDQFIAGGVLLLASSGIIIENACLCYTDVLTGSFLVTGICFLLLALDGKIVENRKRYFFAAAAGIALGLSAAVKYSGLVLAPPVTLLLLICFFIRRPECRRYSWVIAGSAIITAGAYYMPNFIKTGNPFYPVKIPFIFENGFDFERPAVPVKNLWNFFVNDNPWDMNTVTAVVFILLLLGCIVPVFVKRAPEKRELALLLSISAAVLIAAEILMLAIYPAMTQARSIIPFLMSVGIFFPPVLFWVFGESLSGRIAAWGYTAAVIMVALASSSNMGMANLWRAYTAMAVICVIAVIPESARIRRWLFRAMAVIAAAVWCFCNSYRYESALDCCRAIGGQHVMDIVQYLRRDEQQQESQTIASVGCWFNYMLMLDLPGNKVVYIPINKENTSHPHEVASPADLRREPVSYRQWCQRLAEKGCTYLVIDLKSHQDFLENRDQEYRWAKAHPEDFTLICEYEHVSFFKINFR